MIKIPVRQNDWRLLGKTEASKGAWKRESVSCHATTQIEICFNRIMRVTEADCIPLTDVIYNSVFNGPNSVQNRVHILVFRVGNVRGAGSPSQSH